MRSAEEDQEVYKEQLKHYCKFIRKLISGNKILSRKTLEFAQVFLPYDPFHTGIDIAGPTGDPVGAFMSGKVIYAGETSWGFGKHVEIDHGHHITSIYGHLDSIAVKEGDEVEVGTVLGTRGSTGWSTGPHLHFQIDVFGIPVNPRVFLTGDPPTTSSEQIPNPQT